MIIPGRIQKLLDRSGWYAAFENSRESRRIEHWRSRSSSNLPPPHAVKRIRVLDTARACNCHVFVETGTFMGDMLRAMRDDFQELHSIELSERLYARACIRFAGARHIRLHQGDSGRVLGDVVKALDRPAVLWLDAHYSAGVTARGELDSPVIAELEAVAEHRHHDHAILIDDARLFVGEDGYPTIPRLEEMVRDWFPDYSFSVKHDIIEALPPNNSDRR